MGSGSSTAGQTLVAASKAGLKSAASSAGNAIADEAKAQVTTFSSSNPSAGAAASALSDGAAGVLSDAMSKAAAAQKALEGAVDDISDGNIDGLCTSVIGFIGKAVHMIDEEMPSSGKIKDLRMPEYTKAEEGLRKYSAVGQVLTSVAVHAISSLPFGAPVGALLGAVFSRAAQAAHNATAASRLLELMKRIDEKVANLMAADAAKKSDQKGPQEGSDGADRSSSINNGLKRLTLILQRAERVMSAYIGRNFFLRSILSTSDQKSFDDLEKDIKECMQEITTSFVFEQMTSTSKVVPLPDSDKLRKELCRMAGEPEDMVWTEEKASSILASLHLDPEKKEGLLKLLASSTNLETRIIAQEMGAISERVAKLEQQMATVLDRMNEMEISIKMIAVMRRAMEASPGGTGMRLSEFLGLFWVDEFGFTETEVPCQMFCAKLVDIVIKDEGLKRRLLIYVVRLQKEGLLGSSFKLNPESRSSIREVLDAGFIQLVDPDNNDSVSMTELLTAQVAAEKIVEGRGLPAINSWRTLLDAVLLGYDLKSLPRLAASRHDLRRLDTLMKSKEVMRSYNVEALKASYTRGTRQWLYNDIDAWISASTAPAVVPHDEKIG